MKSTLNFERALEEIQTLRKELSTVKIAHESTIHQLQNSHQLNQQLQDLMKKEQTNSHTLRKDIQEKNSIIKQLSEQYEGQLTNIKILIDQKDSEIRKLSSVMSITDYDMIRLRVINELEINHREEIESLNEEIKNLSYHRNQQEKRAELLMQKQAILEQQLTDERDSINKQKDQLLSKHTKEINQIAAQMQIQQRQKRSLQKHIEYLSKKHETTILHYREEIDRRERQARKQNIGFVGNANNIDSQYEIKRMSRLLHEKDNELEGVKQSQKNEHRELFRKFNEVEKQKKYVEEDSDRYKQEAQNAKAELEAQTLRLNQSHQKQLAALRENHERQLQLIKKEAGQKSEVYSQQQIKHQQKTINLKNEQIDQLQAQNVRLGDEIKKLKTKYEELEHNSGTKVAKNIKQTVIITDRKENTKDHSLAKTKLQQANTQIVYLLKEKISLKQQIQTLKGTSK